MSAERKRKRPNILPSIYGCLFCGSDVRLEGHDAYCDGFMDNAPELRGLAAIIGEDGTHGG